ncbi:BamA/TamA family outer membrane protein [Aquicoccus porphyridii]|uniref:BamA/TamA family outer membrane protein n=1 Tax=Aquicoccus porphyridii TaxID=1852029 RepID=UPI00273D24C9|nr:BamA/TamA family outer membrane protein [Aquicoccus porphyridii]
MAYLTKIGIAGALIVATIAVAPGGSAARSYSSVQLRGNEFLKSDDILAVCDISEDENFTSSTKAEIRQCLMSTGQFGGVKFVPEGDTMVIEVEELNSRPGRFEVGLQVDSEEGPIGTVYFERYNLFPGTFGAIELRFSEEFSELTTSLYRKDAFANGWDLGLDTSVTDARYDDQSYEHRRAFIEPYVARKFAGGGRGEIGLGYRSDTIRNVSATSSALIKADAGARREAYLRVSYRHAAENWEAEAKQFFFGLGTGNVISQTQVSAGTRFAIDPDNLVLALRMEGGHVSSLKGPPARISDRFFTSGTALRGFASRGIGPRDGADFLGGENYLVGSVELQKSIGQVFGTPARIGGFVDVGSAWGLSNTLGGGVNDGLDWRASAGLSMTLEFGNVPVSFYLAEPVRKQPGDEIQNFGLSISARF